MPSAGLRCPLCGSWYSDDTEMDPFWEIGEICGNQSGSGLYPSKCSTKHPCPGKLVQDTPKIAAMFRKKK